MTDLNEPVAWRYRFLGNPEKGAPPWGAGQWAVTIQTGLANNPVYEVQPLYAHPSPAPADVAVLSDALEQFKMIRDGTPNAAKAAPRMIARIQAALEGTAK